MPLSQSDLLAELRRLDTRISRLLHEDPVPSQTVWCLEQRRAEVLRELEQLRTER